MSTQEGMPLPTTGARTVFEIDVQTSAVVLEIRVNDVPVLRVPGTSESTLFDINAYVQTGDNLLSVIVRPPEGAFEFPPQASCSVALAVRADPDAETADEHGALVFAAPEIASETLFEQSRSLANYEPAVEPLPLDEGYEARLIIPLATPFPPWAWHAGDILEDTPETFEAVVEATRTLWSLMQAKNVEALEALAAEQAREWQHAYYLPDEATAMQMMGIASTLGDPDISIGPFPNVNTLRLQIFGFGKLAQVVDAEGKDVITLQVRGMPNMVGRYSAVFYRRGGVWRLIR